MSLKKLHLDMFRGDSKALMRIDPASTAPYATDSEGRKNAERDLRQLTSRMQELQNLLYADGRYALLIVLQAMDAGGKDGTIRRVMSGVNPQGVRVTSFKKPTELELSHDYLWRIHKAAPAKGHIGIFNRSHYEDVLIVRVNELVPEHVWRRRYDHINAFEQLLVDNNTVVLKFYLHISKEEQAKRLQRRLDDPKRHWKFDAGDLDVRRRWDDYMTAFSEVFERCSPPHAPWLIVPANRKWYRDVVIAKAIVDALEALPLRYPEPEFDVREFRIEP